MTDAQTMKMLDKSKQGYSLVKRVYEFYDDGIEIYIEERQSGFLLKHVEDARILVKPPGGWYENTFKSIDQCLEQAERLISEYWSQ